MSMNTQEARRERGVVGLLAACGVLTSLQFTFIVPVLPRIPALLGVSATDASWLVTITLLIGVVATPMLTRLADTRGRRRMLLVTMGAVVIGSLIAVIPSFATVMIGRALQGCGTAVVPVGIALMSSLVSPRRAVLGIALMSGTLGIGSALGLTLAGPLVEWGGLTGIFWCTAIVAAALGVLVRIRISEPPRGTPVPLDVPGVLLLTLGLTGLLLVISRGQEWGWLSAPTLTLAGVAALSLAGWVPWERRHPHPLVDVRTTLRAPIAPINVASFFATFGMYANHLLTSQEALAPRTTGYGLAIAPDSAGLLLVPSAVTMIVMSPLAARVIDRHGGRASLILGATIMTLAFLFRLAFHAAPFTVVSGSALVGVGVAFAFASMPALITASTAPAHVASANGVNSVVRTFSGAVAAAAFGLVIAALAAPADPSFLSHDALRLSFAVAALCGALTALLAALIRIPRPEELT